ncbi:MAG: penicillin-binding protein 2 [Oceanospirillaceae bacterium]|nr:penicillin-binding protein 2 [Oceanospirillaceae bacterium]|tara:strand:+ start:30346 stop:32205 length:1860 start_codon:yes stop_codon:yes gene_type:complete
MWEQSFRDKAYERRLFRIRAIIAAIFVLLAFGVLAWRMSYLQVSLHEKYKDLSENNRSQIRPLAPNRGLIYDRNGLLLAENIPSYSLTLVPEKVQDMSRTLEFLDGLIGIDERDREQFDKRLSYSRRPYEPVVLRHRLSEDEIATVLVNRYFLPGVDVEAQLVRHYPFGDAFAHVLGYVGRINQMDQEKIDEDEDRKRRYRATRFIGKNGVERRYEDLLHGEVGYEKVEINARGRLLSTLERSPPQPGQDLVLHLDSRLQLLAAELLKDRRGAIAAIEVKTGGILALYSNPSFDPNDFVTGISYEDYSSLRENPDQPLFDRASRGQYPPASTLKPFVGLAALEAGVMSWQSRVWDPGWFKLENNERLYRDWKREGHGMVDMERAVVESCDVYFYDAATRMGIDHFSSFLARFGFGQDTSLDVVSALPGLLPSKEWKRSQGRGSWYPGDTVNMGIGQGYMLVTPLQLATATAVLANKGHWIMPHLIADGGDIEKEAYARLPDVTLKDPANWSLMHRTMEKVIDSPHGTARALLRDLKFPIAGKTGTAQVVGIEQDAEYDSEALKERQRDHAWFMAFAPVEDPQIAIAVIVENGESSGRTAAPIAQGIINRYLEDKTTDGH